MECLNNTSQGVEPLSGRPTLSPYYFYTNYTLPSEHKNIIIAYILLCLPFNYLLVVTNCGDSIRL